MKLSKKIIISFLSIIVLSIVITSIISSHRINSQFELYLIDEHEKKLNKIAQSINALYLENDYVLYKEQIDSYANGENVSIVIEDLEGEVLYQSIYSPKYNGMMMRHGNHMMKRSQNNQGDYIEKIFPLLKDQLELGQIIIGFYDNSYITRSALIFKETLNVSFVLSGLLSLVLSFFVALLLSRNLSRPLVRITKSTKELQDGNFHVNLDKDIQNSTWEISQLAKSISVLSLSLENQEKIRNQYALDISHELRTPITTIKGYLEAILDNIWEASPSNLNIILEEINRISSLVEDLKNSFLLTSLDSGLPAGPIDLSQELRDIISLYCPLFLEDGQTLEAEIQDQIFYKIRSDELKQIVMNLISNAKNYIARNTGKLVLRLYSQEAYIVIEVEDNGVGIPNSSLPFIFNRLYRVDSSRNQVTGGSGIGLYIVQQLVTKYQGQIQVESQENKGTKFTIKFKQA